MGTKRILLADVDTANRAALAANLREAGDEVDEAGTGDEALRMAGIRRPDVAVLAFDLAGLGALEVLAKLRTRGELACVVMTTDEDQQAVSDAVAAGALGCLLKPVAPAQLRLAVQVAVDWAARLDEMRASCDQLSTALEQGRETSVAVGILMARHQLGRRAAFELLRAHARRTRRKLTELSTELVHGLGAVNDLCEEIRRPSDA